MKQTLPKLKVIDDRLDKLRAEWAALAALRRAAKAAERARIKGLSEEKRGAK